MIASLEDVTRTLIERYGPERIILFGSRASGCHQDDSDFDLLILKETEKRRIDRRTEVELLLAQRSISLDLEVLTPSEMLSAYLAGSPFIEEIAHTGKLLYMRNATASWLEQASREHEMAEILLAAKQYRGACLHAQQCAEKALKTFVIDRKAKLQRTHDLLALSEQVRTLGFAPVLSQEDAAFLSSVYKGRYPSEDGLLPDGEPSAADAQRAVNASSALLQQIKTALSPS